MEMFINQYRDACYNQSRKCWFVVPQQQTLQNNFQVAQQGFVCTVDCT